MLASLQHLKAVILFLLACRQNLVEPLLDLGMTEHLVLEAVAVLKILIENSHLAAHIWDTLFC